MNKTILNIDPKEKLECFNGVIFGIFNQYSDEKPEISTRYACIVKNEKGEYNLSILEYDKDNESWKDLKEGCRVDKYALVSIYKGEILTDVDFEKHQTLSYARIINAVISRVHWTKDRRNAFVKVKDHPELISKKAHGQNILSQADTVKKYSEQINNDLYLESLLEIAAKAFVAIEDELERRGLLGT